MKPTVFNYQEYEKLKEQLDSIVHCKDCERTVLSRTERMVKHEP